MAGTVPEPFLLSVTIGTSTAFAQRIYLISGNTQYSVYEIKGMYFESFDKYYFYGQVLHFP